MQEQNMTALILDTFRNPNERLKTVKPKMETLAKKNALDLEKKETKDFMRSPTANELIEMRQWAIDYKKFHTKASKREVRKATQNHFHIRIFR